MTDGAGLTPYTERVIRNWPRERIKPITVARCLDSVLVELDAARARETRLRVALDVLRTACVARADDGLHATYCCAICLAFADTREAVAHDPTCPVLG